MVVSLVDNPLKYGARARPRLRAADSFAAWKSMTSDRVFPTRSNSVFLNRFSGPSRRAVGIPAASASA